MDDTDGTRTDDRDAVVLDLADPVVVPLHPGIAAPAAPADGTPGLADLQRAANVAAVLLGAPTQIVAVGPAAVRPLAATPGHVRVTPTLARALAAGHGWTTFADDAGRPWSGVCIEAPSQPVRVVLCAEVGAVAVSTARAVLELVDLAMATLKVEQAEQRALSLQMLIGHTSHDLRGPLTVMRAGLEALLDPEPDATPALTRTLGALALKQTGRMTRMLDDMLALHGLEDATTLAPVDLRGVVGEVLESGRLAHEMVDLRLSMPLPLDPTMVLGDRDALIRVLGNLITNAALHGNGSVWVSLTTDRRRADVCVEDDGPGLPPNTALDGGGRVRRPGGHGLGLVIAQRIVAAHHGHLVHEPRRGGGTRIHVRLPLD